MSISTHVLDAVTGRPATGLLVTLERRTGDAWQVLTRRSTGADGRVADLFGDTAAGVYRLGFDTGGYLGPTAFYPEVTVVFRISDSGGHCHIPLLLSPFAFSTYCGS
jgi:5-hydroxyisourate hydrolase